ncbi:DUF6234 family protein [Streptomyces sp. NPDC057620]|uniref:DUF6234 family protein n=1 Tax=Streptomyces sp. NPDC057620 TaxID=3346185 RepID=UPI0036B2A05D
MANVKLLADLGLAMLLSALEAVALVGFWFTQGMKQWAAQGQWVPDPTGRYLLVLSTASASAAAIAYGLAWADLPKAMAAQAVMATLFALLLFLVAGTAWLKRLRRNRRRRRLRRERLRWHESQRDGSTPASASVRRRRWRL